MRVLYIPLISIPLSEGVRGSRLFAVQRVYGARRKSFQRGQEHIPSGFNAYRAQALGHCVVCHLRVVVFLAQVA